jgi:hypothetical protein
MMFARNPLVSPAPPRQSSASLSRNSPPTLLPSTDNNNNNNTTTASSPQKPLPSSSSAPAPASVVGDQTSINENSTGVEIVVWRLNTLKTYLILVLIFIYVVGAIELYSSVNIFSAFYVTLALYLCNRSTPLLLLLLLL